MPLITVTTIHSGRPLTRLQSFDGEVVHHLAGPEHQPADRAEEQVVPRHQLVPPCEPVDQRDRQHRYGLG